jgi:hypothetical protein
MREREKVQKTNVQKNKEEMKLGNRGELWPEIMIGVFMLAAVGVLYIILDQAWEKDIRPDAITEGTDATNLAIIDAAWDMWPIPVVLAYLFGVLRTGRKAGGGQINVRY